MQLFALCGLYCKITSRVSVKTNKQKKAGYCQNDKQCNEKKYFSHSPLHRLPSQWRKKKIWSEI